MATKWLKQVNETDSDTKEPLDTITGSGFDNIKGLFPKKMKRKKKKKKRKKTTKTTCQLFGTS